MKKYLILVPLLFLAAACSKPAAQNSTPPDNVNVGVSTSTSATGTQLSLNAYNDSQYKYKVLYSSEFDLSHQPKADPTARDYFALKADAYKNTNLVSAAVSIKILSNKKNIGECAVMGADEINGGRMTDSKTVNGVNFLTAVSSDAGASNFYETHYNRAWYGTFCIEIDATVHSTSPDVYDTPRTAYDYNQVWYKLQVLINSFQFNK